MPPDQMPHSAVSDLGLHSLPIDVPQKGRTRLIWVYIIILDLVAFRGIIPKTLTLSNKTDAECRLQCQLW